MLGVVPAELGNITKLVALELGRNFITGDAVLVLLDIVAHLRKYYHDDRYILFVVQWPFSSGFTAASCWILTTYPPSTDTMQNWLNAKNTLYMICV